MTVKVVIDTPGPTITVEADEPLNDVAAKALELFQAAGGWPQHGNTVGFGTVASTTERRGTWDAHQPLNAGGAT